MADCAPCSKHKQKRNISQKNIFYCTKSYLPTLKNLDKYIAINNVYASKICFHFRRRVGERMCCHIFFFLFSYYTNARCFPACIRHGSLHQVVWRMLKDFLFILLLFFVLSFYNKLVRLSLVRMGGGRMPSGSMTFFNRSINPYIYNTTPVETYLYLV